MNLDTVRHAALGFFTSVILAVFLVGCASTGEQNGRVFGGLGGAAAGAFLGDFADCKGCALIGALVGLAAGQYAGGQIGRRMDEHDAMMTQRAVHSNRTGQMTAWTNPDNNTRYDVTPVRTFTGSGGQPCREVRFGQAEVGQERQEVYGTACYDGVGGWKVQ